MMTEHSEEQIEVQEGITEEENTLSVEDQLRLELQEANESKLRALADFKNFQRRSLENETRAAESGMVRVVRAVLPAVEQMNMAISHGGDAAVIEGFKMALGELMKGLAECGVSIIEPKQGDEFDPQKHEAMMREEVEGVETDHVVSMMQTGYALGDTVLQPAKVSVGA